MERVIHAMKIDVPHAALLPEVPITEDKPSYGRSRSASVWADSRSATCHIRKIGMVAFHIGLQQVHDTTDLRAAHGPDGRIDSFAIRYSHEVEIADSARKHQVRDRFDGEDIRHAVAHAVYAADDGDDSDKALYLGPDPAARFLEVVVVLRADGSELVIHAMKMRRAYAALLPGGAND